MGMQIIKKMRLEGASVDMRNPGTPKMPRVFCHPEAMLQASLPDDKKKAGDVLLSHAVTHAVPSTQKSLTTEFGMGSGVASSLLSPARL